MTLMLEAERCRVAAHTGLSLAFLPAAELKSKDPDWWGQVLGVAAFGSAPGAAIPESVPRVAVHMPRLDGGDGVHEVWRADGPLRSGRLGPLRYRCNDRLMFGAIELDEQSLACVPPGAPSALQQVAEAAYRRLFSLLDEAGYPGLFRVWNYFPGINAQADGSERYWQFNAGRQDAFLDSGRTIAGHVPAACALGSHAGAFSLYFLALREPPRPIENPRQICAYHYPSEYGPRSPTFSRASLSAIPGAPVLFVSGTASIVGHRTLHAGDVVAQTEESLRNIEAVLAEARRVAPRLALRPQDLVYKIYVRERADFERVRACFERWAGDEAPAVYLQADVCRADLLVEIEASGGHAVEMTR